MTDARRKAAEEWAGDCPVIVVYDEQWNLLRYIGAKAEKMVTRQVEDAHLAGQECGERREREAERAATVKWLREGMLAIFGIAFPTLADYIERGEHREEE